MIRIPLVDATMRTIPNTWNLPKNWPDRAKNGQKFLKNPNFDKLLIYKPNW